jgi:putative transposase
MRMHLTHKIALCPTPEQVDYFKRACGTARRVWNWALNEWNKQYASGGKPNAMALKKQFNAIKFRGRRLSRKLEAAKEMAGYGRHACLPKGTHLPASNNRQKSAATLARLHARLANRRADFTHKLTTRLCRKNQALVIEDLNVKGMLANERLARAISDVGFGVFRSQLEYKAKRYGTHLIIADRWYPSSRLCSICGWKNEALTLRDREWVCAECGAHHDRDLNAALNLKRLATETALPVESDQ